MNTFDVSIVGAGTPVSAFPLDDLSDVLRSVHGLVASFGEAAEGGQSGGSDSPKLTLQSVSPAGDYWRFTGNDAARQAEQRLSQALESGDVETLPGNARAHLRLMQSVLARSPGDVSVQLFADQPQPFVVTKQHGFRAPQTICERTTIYVVGERIERDDEGPVLVAKLDDDRRFTVRLAGDQLAEEIGRHLHQRLELKGEAERELPSWRLVRFRATALASYREVKPDFLAMLRRLEAIAPGRWDGVDPQAFVDEMRGDDVPDQR